MAFNPGPINPAPPITPQMVANAKRALGACGSCADKLAAFKAAGLEYADLEAVNNDLTAKAQSLLAAAEPYYSQLPSAKDQ